MPATKRPKPLYQRGIYALYPREGRNLEIVWYDSERRRERSASAGTRDVAQGRKALDRAYLEDGGDALCPTCHRPMTTESPYIARAITDYLIKQEGRAGYRATSARLVPAVAYITETDPKTRCSQADATWIEKYRKWLALRPVFNSQGEPIATYSIGHIEGCVRQLAAAINATPGQTAQFKAEQVKLVSKSPRYRAPIAKLAAMFDYCLRPDAKSDAERTRRIGERQNLLRYLRMAVATWARPEAIFEVRPAQWASEARVLDLNPIGRRQTKKHRPMVPIAKQYAPFLDSGDAYLPIAGINVVWGKMAKALKLPTGREAGPKIIRRSVSTIARKRLGEERWQQGQMMLGHVKYSVSDIYAIPDPANLGRVLRVTESIIDEIEKLAPGAFYRNFTATGNALTVHEGGLSA